MYIFNAFYLPHSYNPRFLIFPLQGSRKAWAAPRSVSFWGLIQNFRRASPPLSYTDSPPPPRAGSSRRCQLSKPHLKYRMKKIYVSRSFVECVRGRGERQNGFKTESTTELSNFHFWWTKPLYQNKLSNIAFFFTFFKGQICNKLSVITAKKIFYRSPRQ